MSIPAELVHNHQNTVESTTFGKTFNKIQGYYLPNNIRYRKRLQEPT
jgi:hypothetical protein